MKINRLKKKIGGKEVALGTFLFVPSPAVVEILGHAGFDFAIIDTEHAPMSPLDTTLLENLVRAAEVSGVTPLVRLPEASKIMTQKVLDAGAVGVVVPGIRTREDAEGVVRASRYPPEGERGCCSLTRPTGYSAKYTGGYWAEANRNAMVALLIENREAVENLEGILSVPGIDFIFFGPRDYSMSLGYADVNNPETLEARRKVEMICEKNGVPLARFLYPPFRESVRGAVEEGARILVAGADVSLLHWVCRDLVEALEKPR